MPVESSLLTSWTYILSVLASGTVDDGQTAGDEIILDIHHHLGGAGASHLLDPLRPAEDKLILEITKSRFDIEHYHVPLHLAQLSSRRHVEDAD